MTRNSIRTVDGKPVVVSTRAKDAKLPTTELYAEELAVIEQFIEKEQADFERGKNPNPLNSKSKLIREAVRAYIISKGWKMPDNEKFEQTIGDTGEFVIWRKSSVTARDTKRRKA